MITYKCKNCGGQLDFGGSGGFICPFCGSRSFFSDADFKGNEQFRNKLLQYYKAEAENRENDYSADALWSSRGFESFIMKDGQQLGIEYMEKFDGAGYVCYLAKESVVYVFHGEADAAAFMRGVNRMVFPPADVKLHRSFPEFKMEIGLKNGETALVFKRRPLFYPARMFAPFASEHLAWVISRMENICCALSYADIEHGGISPLSVWINPMRHEGALFGDWRGVRSLKGTADLEALRKTAIELAADTRKPKQLYDFLNSKPAESAFADFARWDKVIEKGFGGHKFIKMSF